MTVLDAQKPPSTSIDKPEQLTTDEVADVCRCEPRTVRRWIRRRILPGVRINRRWLIPRSAVEQLLSALSK
jgi:excisionase family DNA binding protein